MKTSPKEQTWGRSNHVRRDERVLSLAQIDKLYHELKWNMLIKRAVLGFLLAEIRMHKPSWFQDLLISWCMKHAWINSILYCCDRKSRAACAQSFALWQKATIEFTCHDHSPRTLVIKFNRSQVISAELPRHDHSFIACSRHMLLFAHIPFVVNHTFNATPSGRLQQHPLHFQRTAPIARSLCEVCTWHDLHILVTAPFCCDRKARAACAQSFALWQQATIETMRRNHSSRSLVVTFNRSQVDIGRASTPRSLFYCLLAPNICIVVLRAHPIRGESHIQRNANGEVATVSQIAYKC